MVALHIYTLSLIFAPIFVLSSTMLGNCNAPGLDTDESPGQKCFVPCPPTQNDDFKLVTERALGNGSFYCSYFSDDQNGSCQYSTRSGRLEAEQGDPEIDCAPCLDVIPSCSDCDDSCEACEECNELLHTCQDD